MRCGPVILRLEGQESVDRRNRGGIFAPDPDFASPGKGVRQVSNDRAPGGHYRGAGNRLRMDETGKREIAPAEPDRDVLHMGTDGGGPGGVDAVALEHDPAAVGQRLEHMRRGVLIDAHGDGAASLHRNKPAVGPGPRIGARGPGAAQEQGTEDEASRHHAKLSSD